MSVSTCGLPHTRGCGTCDSCNHYKAQEAARAAERAAEVQSIHEAKVARLRVTTKLSNAAKTEARIQKARQKLCNKTPPRGHVSNGDGQCVGCGKQLSPQQAPW
jgi:hypothetical protein